MFPALYEVDETGELTGGVTFYCSNECRLSGVPYVSTVFGEAVPDRNDYVCPICQARLVVFEK